MEHSAECRGECLPADEKSEEHGRALVAHYFDLVHRHYKGAPYDIFTIGLATPMDRVGDEVVATGEYQATFTFGTRSGRAAYLAAGGDPSKLLLTEDNITPRFTAEQIAEFEHLDRLAEVEG